MTWRKPPVSFSRYRNIHLPVQQGDTRKTVGLPLRNTNLFLFFGILFFPGLPSNTKQLVCGRRDMMLLSRAEKERLAELLQEIDEEEEAASRGPDSEVGRHQVLSDNMCWRFGNTSSHMSQSLPDDDCLPLLPPFTAAHTVSVNDARGSGVRDSEPDESRYLWLRDA